MSRYPHLLQREWLGFIEAVEIADAPAGQLREMRRAFFAGAQAFFGIVLRNSDPGETLADGDLALLDALDAELARLGVDVPEGRA